MRPDPLAICELSERALKRFLSSIPIRPDEGCWPWMAEVNKDGYGRFSIKGKRRFAHRIAFSLAYGPMVSGRLVLHRCDNPRCVRADHLFLGSDKDNSDDMANKGRHRLQSRPWLQAGERNPIAKLTAALVQASRERYSLGGIEIGELARSYGIGAASLRLAIKGITWKHVGGPIASGDQRNRTSHWKHKKSISFIQVNDECGDAEP